MREIDVLRRHYQEVAQRQAGIGRGLPLVTQAEVANAHADTDVERLPEAYFDVADIQTAGGGWMFMIDVSVIDGPEAIG
jgi:hypothetical protein